MTGIIATVSNIGEGQGARQAAKLSSVTLAELLFGIAVLPAGKRKHQSWYCHTRSRRQHIALLPEMIKISKGLSGSSLRNLQRLGP